MINGCVIHGISAIRDIRTLRGFPISCITHIWIISSIKEKQINGTILLINLNVARFDIDHCDRFLFITIIP